MATAAVAAGAGIHVAFFGNAAQFKGLGDVLDDGLLQFLHVFLRVEKSARDGIVHEGIAQLLEILDFRAVQGLAGLLLLLKRLAFGDEDVILAAGFVVGFERGDALAHGSDIGLVQNGLAEFTGLLDDDIFFSLSLHNNLCDAAVGAFAFNRRATQYTTRRGQNQIECLAGSDRGGGFETRFANAMRPKAVQTATCAFPRIVKVASDLLALYSLNARTLLQRPARFAGVEDRPFFPSALK
jgi:hypothetical protein